MRLLWIILCFGCFSRGLSCMELGSDIIEVNDMNTETRPDKLTNQCVFTDSACSIRCFDTGDLLESIKEAMSISNDTTKPCGTLSFLGIYNQTFPEMELNKGWLNSNMTIFELELIDSKIEHIKAEAFDSRDFERTFSLKLQNLHVAVLVGGLLLGLPRLEFLIVVCPVIAISRSFLQPVRTSLRYFKISGLSGLVTLSEIFGISEMVALEHLDLSGNTFEEINAEGLRRLSKVRYLSLAKSGVKTLGCEPFRRLYNTLQVLDLSDNQITTIAASDFHALIEINRAYVYLGRNQLVCNCELEDFARDYEMAQDMFVDILVCKGPSEHIGKLINEVDYICDHHSTVSPKEELPETTEERIHSTYDHTTKRNVTGNDELDSSETTGGTSTILENIAPTGMIPKDLVELTCLPQNGDVDNSDIEYLYFPPPFYEFSIELVSENSVKLVIEEYNTQPVIIWYDDPENYNVYKYETSNSGCRFYENDPVVIGNLLVNVSYTFCLVPQGDEVISPFNCLPFYIPMRGISANDTWITHDQKTMAISIYCLLILFCGFLGCYLTYFCVKENPSLLKGSKHVFVIEESEKSEISTISGKETTTNQKFCLPPPYEVDSLSSGGIAPYEVPMESTDEKIIYSDQFCPKSPPPLPKRNSEHIYGEIMSPILRHKRSV